MSPRRTVHRSLALVTLAALLAVTGCNVVKAGARCKAGTPAGRDATHVLFCQKGKWTRVMTIGQAADFLMASWPSTVTLVEGGGQTTGVGESFAPVVVRVTRKDGSPVKGADVRFSNADPGAAAGMASPSGLIATDADGIARFTPVANGVLGGYGVDAKVNGGVSPYVTFGLNNVAAQAASISVVSGAGQTEIAGTQQFAAPVVVKAVDRFGNVVTNKNVEFSTTFPDIWFGPAQVYVGDDGLASTTMGAGNKAGSIPVTARVVGTDTTTTFTMTVAPGPIFNNLRAGGDGETANPGNNNRFNNPQNVAISDVFGNPVIGQPVTYAVIPGGGGASGVLDATTVLVGADGFAHGWVTGNGVSGSFTVTATVGGVTHTFTLNNP